MAAGRAGGGAHRPAGVQPTKPTAKPKAKMDPKSDSGGIRMAQDALKLLQDASRDDFEKIFNEFLIFNYLFFHVYENSALLPAVF